MLNAIYLGYAVPHNDFDATVHSVFHEAANLQPLKTNLLVTLVKSENADLPQGIRIATPAGFSFESLLQPGDRITRRNGILVDNPGRIEISLAQAKRWICKLPNLAADRITPQVVSAWELVWQALIQRQKEVKADLQAEALIQTGAHQRDHVSRKISEFVKELVEAVCNHDDSTEASLKGLIGLGAGLTPSGDDFLVGFLAGLHCLVNDQGDRSKYLEEFGERVIHLSHRTNDISRTYLVHAAHGQVSSGLADLAKAIVEVAGSDRLHFEINKAFQVGHTSGIDTVTGLLMGIATWGNRSINFKHSLNRGK